MPSRGITRCLDGIGNSELQHWMVEQGVSYPVAADPTGQIAQQYGVKGVPASVIIDARGKIRFAEVGYTTAARQGERSEGA
jgi:alkyl hydroperoxide reductase subunit AhpC